jgi:cytochrome c553
MTQISALLSLLLLIPGLAFAQAAGNPEAGKEKAQVCAACHGPDGNSTDPQYPVLAGQTWRYLYLQMKDYKEGRRTNQFMNPLMKDMSKKDMYDLAAYYSQQKASGQNEKGDPALIEEGRKVAENALCTMCHLGGFKGQNEVPRVAGQHYSYIVAQLKAFKNKERTNDAGTMTAYMSDVSVEQMKAVAAYVASLRD